jgi:hypothetical protein
MLNKIVGFILDRIPLSGFEFSEDAHGTHRFVERRKDKGEMPFSFSFHARTDEFKKVLYPDYRDFLRLEITGKVSMEEVASGAPFNGTLEISLLRKRQLTYEFSFKSERGIVHRFHGHKDLSFFQPLKSITTMYGEVLNTRTGKVISTTVSFLDLRDLPGLFGSFRIR